MCVSLYGPTLDKQQDISREQSDMRHLLVTTFSFFYIGLLLATKLYLFCKRFRKKLNSFYNMEHVQVNMPGSTRPLYSLYLSQETYNSIALGISHVSLTVRLIFRNVILLLKNNAAATEEMSWPEITFVN